MKPKSVDGSFKKSGEEMFVGIDGGGTKTKIVIIDKNQNIVASAEGGPSGIRSVPWEVGMDTIAKTLNKAFSMLSKPYGVTAVFAGLADVSCEADEKKVALELTKLDVLQHAKIQVKNDVYNAYRAAINDDQGIIIIAGTGSVSFGKNSKNETHRSGGFSYHEGDPGSAYDLGKKTIKILAKTIDGRLLDSPFTLALKSNLKAENYEQAVALFNTLGHDRIRIAELAKSVTKYADLGDIHALNLCESGTEELVMMIKNVAETLNIKKCTVGLIGSLCQAKTHYQKKLIDKIKAYNPNFDVIVPDIDPAYGAALCAYDSIL